MKLLPGCVLLLLLPLDLNGQCVLPADSAAPADVRIFARVRASELTFTTAPRADVATLGCAPIDTVRVLVRTNLPEPVVAGVTYRDVEVAVEIVTRLSVMCSPALIELIDVRSTPRLAALCASNPPPGENRRQP